MYMKSAALQKAIFAFSMCILAPAAWADYSLYVYDPAEDLFEVQFDGTIDDLFHPSPGGHVTTVPTVGEGSVPMFFLSDFGNTCSSSQTAREQGAINSMQSGGYAPIQWSVVQITLADGHMDIWTRSGGGPAIQHYWDWNASNCP